MFSTIRKYGVLLFYAHFFSLFLQQQHFCWQPARTAEAFMTSAFLIDQGAIPW